MPRLSTRVELALVVLIVAVAAFLRFYLLNVIPVGWHHDEALMGLMAKGVYLGDDRPIFFPGYLGQEPLYIYLAAGVMWLMGGNTDVLPLRIASALVGVGTVGVAYLLGRELFNRRVGLIGAALLALSFWHIMLSRDGYRVITQPLLEGITVFLLWRASRRNSLWYYAAAGVAFGGTIYTYLGARLFPGVLVLFGIWGLVAYGLPPARMRRGIAIFVVVAAAVAAPLLIYFATHPGTFSARINQVNIFEAGVVAQSPARALLDNLVKLLGTFTIRGEALWRYNLAGRPIFVGAVGLFFYVGLIAALVGALRRKPGSALAIAWFVTMLFPSFLSWDVGGYTFRSLGQAPSLFLLPAVGLVAIWDWVAAKVTPSWKQRSQYAFLSLAVIVLLVEGGTTYRDYFVDWSKSFGGAYESMQDIVDGARFLEKEARPGVENIFISSDYYPHPVVTQLAPTVSRSARWFDGNHAIVLSPESTKSSLYLFPYAAMPQHLDGIMPPEALVEKQSFDNGVTKFAAYRLTPAQSAAVVQRILDDPTYTHQGGNLADVVELLAYKVDPRVEQGKKLGVTALWRILKDSPSQEYVTFAHLLDNEFHMYAQVDTSSAFPNKEWRAGDIVLAQYDMDIETRVAPGKYRVSMGVYDRATMKKLLIKGAGPKDDEFSLDSVKVASAKPLDVAPSTVVNKKLGQEVTLLGYDLQRPSQPAGTSALRLTLYWQALVTPPEDYTVFVQVLDAEGRPVVSGDGQPVSGHFPTSYWEPGDRIVDTHDLTLDKNVPPGKYRIIAGMYQLASGQRLPVDGGGDFVLLQELDIQP